MHIQNIEKEFVVVFILMLVFIVLLFIYLFRF